jgi:quinate dehydrogenase (quinone)
MADATVQSRWAAWPVLLLSLVMLVGGGYLLIGGVQLISLGGSCYFAIAGAGLLLSAWFLARNHVLGLYLFLLVFLGTIIWAIWEVGLQFWPLVSRLVAPAVLGILIFLAAPSLKRGGGRPGQAPSYVAAALLVLALAATGYRAFQPVPYVAATGAPEVVAETADVAENWQHYGRTPAGTRYSPSDQITPANVGELEVAWEFRHGDFPVNETGSGAEDQNTPMQVGDTVYVCTVRNVVHALDADTGEERWSFDPQAESPLWQRCRSVGYYESTGNISAGLQTIRDAEAAEQAAAEAAEADAAEELAEGEQPAPEGEEQAAAPAPAEPEETEVAQQTDICQRRIVLSTIDARLIQLDAETGELCPQFGENGTVDLKVGMGEVRPGFYFQTSAPTVANGIIVIGGWVVDNVAVGLPSGVVRGFDAETGELVWAWDLGNPDITRFPPEGETYTRGTPNVWTHACLRRRSRPRLPAHRQCDARLLRRASLRAQRKSTPPRSSRSTSRPAASAGISAPSITTSGTMIVPSQPALYDMPDGHGTRAALIQTTKRGADLRAEPRDRRARSSTSRTGRCRRARSRATGPPRRSPIPSACRRSGRIRLTEARMWGTTPFDQLYCRIEFLQASLRWRLHAARASTPSLQWPGFYRRHELGQFLDPRADRLSRVQRHALAAPHPARRA